MRFDRRHVQGPDAGFLGTDIDVMTITGSVSRDVEQQYRSYDFEPGEVPLCGYPRSFGDLYVISSIIDAEGSASYLAASNTEFAGNGFDIDGENSYSVNNYNPNGFGVGVGKWTFPSFTISNRGDGLPADFGPPWYAAAKYDGVPTFITTASFEAAPGPRVMSDLGVAPPVSGARADVDYALRFMTTSSFLYTNVTLFSQPSHVMVFKYTDPTIGFDIFSSGLPTDPGGATATHEMISGTLHWGVPSGATVTASIDPDRWYLVAALSDDLSGGSPRAFISLTVIPFFGGEAPRTSFFPAVAAASFSASYLGNHRHYSASSAMQLSAFYLTTSAITLGAGTGFDDSQMIRAIDSMVAKMQRCMSSQLRVKYKSSDAITNSLTAFGTDLERQYLNQKLLGLGTGGLGRSFGVTSFVTGSTPSWTNSHIRNSSFIATVLSSSDHESQVLNYYLSGTELLESTAVPASAKLYYVKTGSYSGNNLTKKEGMSTKIVLLTGSAVNGDYALAYRLTGALADLSGSTPGWLLNNQFSMPWIPISSASLVDFTVEPVVSIHPQDILAVTPILGGAERLQDAARIASPPRTRAQYAADVVTGSLI